MAAAAAIHGAVPVPQRKTFWAGTPEVYFFKPIDNSRLVKVEDPAHGREMKQFGFALGCLFLLVMMYAFQHFKAIEYGYKIEALKSQRGDLLAQNRKLQMQDASLRSPERIDTLARQMGLQSPQAGQVIRMDSSTQDSGQPVMAMAAATATISVR
ncbi:MAG TPA: cell division protein FtsL [Terriglobales bacterium]|nr:cell division protein FtsL [Terriglobales bacterium]